MSDCKISNYVAKIHIRKNKTDTEYNMPQAYLNKCSEFYFLLSGRMKYFAGHTVYDISPGNVVIIPCCKIHKTAAIDKSNSEGYTVYFYDEYLKNIVCSIGKDVYEKFIEGGCFKLPPERADMIRKYLISMERESLKKDAYSEAVMCNIFRNIVLSVLRYGNIKMYEAGADGDKIKKVAMYISENYASDITLDCAAKMAFMEKTYFSKKFKLLTGTGFNEYLTKTRIKAAEAFLRFSDLSIGRISECCGFSGSNYFGDVFKRYNGISPSEYRKRESI